MFSDGQFKTIRPKKKAITEKQKLLTAAFCFCLHLACKVMRLAAFQAGFTFWFLSDNYQGPSTEQSCKIRNWGCECNLFWFTEIQATQVKPHFHSFVSGIFFQGRISGDQPRHFEAAHCRSLMLRNTPGAESSVDIQLHTPQPQFN